MLSAESSVCTKQFGDFVDKTGFCQAFLVVFSHDLIPYESTENFLYFILILKFSCALALWKNEGSSEYHQRMPHESGREDVFSIEGKHILYQNLLRDCQQLSTGLEPSIEAWNFIWPLTWVPEKCFFLPVLFPTGKTLWENKKEVVILA